MRKRYLVLMATAAVATMAQQPEALKDILAQVAKYEYGQSRAPIIDLGDFVRKAMVSAVERQEVEAALDEVLESDATRSGKDAVCRELSLIGSEKSVPALTKLLAQGPMAEVARYALERIPGPKVDAELRAAVARSNRKTEIGIINTLGRRRDAAAVPVLEPLLSSSDTVIVAAAADALATIADEPARAALAAALVESTGSRHAGIADASIRCADRLVRGKQQSAALAIYRNLYKPSEPVNLRIAALTGLAVSRESALPFLAEAIDQNDPRLRAVAIRLLAGVPGAGAIHALIERLPQLPPGAMVQAISALADRRDRTVLPVLSDMLRSQHAEVRVAALEGLGKIGDKSAVIILARTAAAATGDEQNAARQSLNMLPGRDVDEAIIMGLAIDDAKVRLELIKAAGERPIRAAAVPLLTLARDPNPEVRRESIRSLRDIAGPEQTSALISLVQNAGQSSERRDAQRALLSALRQSKQPRGPELMSACRSARDAETKTALMEVMAQTGSEDALPLFREWLAQGDDDLRRGAINALSQWTSAAPAPDLLVVARSGPGTPHQIIALRGYVKLVELPCERPPAETAKMLGSALELATQPGEKRAVLAALQRAPSLEALRVAESALNDAAVAPEAKTAVNALKRALSQR